MHLTLGRELFLYALSVLRCCWSGRGLGASGEGLTLVRVVACVLLLAGGLNNARQLTGGRSRPDLAAQRVRRARAPARSGEIARRRLLTFNYAHYLQLLEEAYSSPASRSSPSGSCAGGGTSKIVVLNNALLVAGIAGRAGSVEPALRAWVENACLAHA